MTILAIDPSINETGWAFGHADEPFESGVIRTRGKTDAEKLYDLEIELREILDRSAPMSAVVEIPHNFSHRKASSARGKPLNAASMAKLNRAVGVILCVLQRNTIAIEELPPDWKGFVGKKLAQGITGKKNHNEADAILMYRYSKARKI